MHKAQTRREELWHLDEEDVLRAIRQYVSAEAEILPQQIEVKLDMDPVTGYPSGTATATTHAILSHPQRDS